MNVAAMPHTLFIILAELAVGSLLIVEVLDARRMAPRSFVRFSATSIWAIAGLTWWLAAALPTGGDIDGYRLDESAFTAVRWSAFLMFAFALPWALFSLGRARMATLLLGAASAAAGVVLLLNVAALVGPPTWGYAGAALSVIAGALAVGGVSTAMLLGHWYLVTPRLPERPLNVVTFGLMVALIAQVALLALNLAMPVREAPAAGSSIGIGQNPAFWLRLLGLLFPIVLSWMAWQSSRVRAMNSATGLLYLAMASVLGGELLARGLLFVTAKAV